MHLKDSPYRIVLLGCLLSLLIHLPFMDMPPRGNHTWRQCNTLSVARNFYEEEMNIFKPRIDRREDTDGVTGMQFPSYEFIVATIYHFTGERFWVHRFVQFAIFIIGVLGFFRLVIELTDNELLAAMASWLFTWSPELFFHGINALPDILALTSSIWGFYWFVRYLNKQQGFSLALSCGALCLAGATKLQYLAVGGGMLGLLILHAQKMEPKQIIKLMLFGMVILGISGAWYLYADTLTRNSGLNDFVLHVRPFPPSDEALLILRSILQVKIPETLVGYAATVSMVIGIYFAAKNQAWKKSQAMVVFSWCIILMVYFILELAQFEHHNYYLLPLLPVFFLLSGYGCFQLLSANKSWLIGLILISAPVLTVARIVPGWLKDPKIPHALYDGEKREALQGHIPANELIIAGNDGSSGTYLYFLHAKGWAFNDQKPLIDICPNGSLAIENYIDRGATVLVSDESAEQLSIKNHIDSLIHMESGFWVYKLKPSSDSASQ